MLQQTRIAALVALTVIGSLTPATAEETKVPETSKQQRDVAVDLLPPTTAWESESGEDGRVRVTLSLNRVKLPPGESVAIEATSLMLSDEALVFPANYGAPWTRVYLQTPNHRLFVYSGIVVSMKRNRPMKATDYRGPTILKKGQGRQILGWDIPLVDPSPFWFDAQTEEPVRPNLRTQGTYEVWAVYKIPEIQGSPAGAWHGSITTGRIRFVVRDIPAAERRQAPTTEQAEHLTAYLTNNKTQLECREMPHWLNMEDRLKWALGRTENEGLARRMVELLRKHQPEEPGEAYPDWWWNVNYLVGTRAYHHLPYGGGRRCDALRIIGPYLDEYAAVQTTELERWAPGQPYGFNGPPADFLLTYLKHKPNSPLRQRVEAWARRHVRIPTDAKPNDRKIFHPVGACWQILFSLGVLRDGMAWADARDILGEPTARDGAKVEWCYDTGATVAPLKVVGNVSAKRGVDIIIFIQRGT
ncbi:MAG: hypothetical protein ACYC35_21510 [Pirellulales bacterium]